MLLLIAKPLLLLKEAFFCLCARKACHFLKQLHKRSLMIKPFQMLPFYPSYVRFLVVGIDIAASFFSKLLKFFKGIWCQFWIAAKIGIVNRNSFFPAKISSRLAHSLPSTHSLFLGGHWYGGALQVLPRCAYLVSTCMPALYIEC